MAPDLDGGGEVALIIPGAEPTLPGRTRAVRPAGHEPPTPLRRNLNLLRELSITQFKLKYTGSVLGYLWSLLKPLMIFAVMYAVFARLLRAGGNSPNFTMQLLVGIVIWNFFLETTVTAMNSIAANGTLIKKAFFPRSILVLASSLTAFMTFSINLTLIVLVAGPIGKLSIGLPSLAVIPLVLELYVLVLGISLGLSALFVFYRDLGHVWEITAQVLFFGSGVVYALDPGFLHGKEKVIALNPVAQIIEDMRHALVVQDPRVPWTVVLLGWEVVVPLGIVAILAVAGVAIFRACTPRFAEEL